MITNFPSSPTPEQQSELESFLRGRSQNRTDSMRKRAHSLSPPRQARQSWNEAGTKDFLKERFDNVLTQFKAGLNGFLDEQGSRRASSVGLLDDLDKSENGIVSSQLRLIAQDVLRAADFDELSGSYFRETTESLAKLMEHCTPFDPILQRIRKLLLMISRPARLIECLEFSPDEPRDDMVVANDVDMKKLDVNIPMYILSKLTTHFGAPEQKVCSPQGILPAHHCADQF